jgi:DNA-binding CsgD family transcriptional regulator
VTRGFGQARSLLCITMMRWFDEAVAAARQVLDEGCGVAAWLMDGDEVICSSSEAGALLETSVRQRAVRLALLGGSSVAWTRDVTYVSGGEVDAFSCIIAAVRARPLRRHRRHALRQLALSIDLRCRLMRVGTTPSFRDLGTRPGLAIDPARAWEDLLGGRLSTLETFDDGDRRYIIARRATVSRTTTSPLSEREIEIVTLVARGHANKYIAYELGIAEQTVATHLARARSKLGARSRLDVIALFAGRQPSAA